MLRNAAAEHHPAEKRKIRQLSASYTCAAPDVGCATGTKA